MSNVVQFLEALARNPKPLSAADFAIAVTNAELEPVVSQAVLDGDLNALNNSLGGRLMMCIIVPAENDEPQEDESKEGDEPSEQETSSRAA